MGAAPIVSVREEVHRLHDVVLHLAEAVSAAKQGLQGAHEGLKACIMALDAHDGALWQAMKCLQTEVADLRRRVGA